MRQVSFLLLLVFLSCSISQKKGTSYELKLFDFKAFSFYGPSTWKVIEKKGVDSFVSDIAMGKGDTISFDYGNYSNALTETEPKIVPKNFKQTLIKENKDTSGYFFTDEANVDIDKVRKQNVTFTTIDGREAKIVFPRRPGIGMTGIYFDRIADGSPEGRIRFNMLGYNLQSENEKALLQAFQTLKFSKK